MTTTDKLAAWAAEAVDYVNSETRSPSLEREGREILAAHEQAHAGENVAGTVFDAVARAMDMASMLAGAVAHNEVEQAGAYSASLRRKLWRIAALAEQRATPQPAQAPQEPPPGLLMSMAIRYDHALGLPGYYDSELFKGSGVTHAQRLESTLRTMRQLWEEVVGRGFYSPEREAQYAELGRAKESSK